MTKNIVFLIGNSGRQYKNTRHNIGWLFGDWLLAGQSTDWSKSKFSALIADTPSQPATKLVKSWLMVNRSGESCRQILNFYKLNTDKLLVVHDDSQLPFGKCRLKKGGGAAGHNGLRSISRNLADESYWRLRLGIGRPEQPVPLAGYVLSRFDRNQEKQLDDLFFNAQKLYRQWREENEK